MEMFFPLIDCIFVFIFCSLLTSFPILYFFRGGAPTSLLGSTEPPPSHPFPSRLAVYLTGFLCSLQTLDSAFSEQDRSQQRQAPARSSSSPPRGRSPPPRHRSTPRAPGGAPLGRGPGRHKAVGPRKSIHGKHAGPAQNDTALYNHNYIQGI